MGRAAEGAVGVYEWVGRRALWRGPPPRNPQYQPRKPSIASPSHRPASRSPQPKADSGSARRSTRARVAPRWGARAASLRDTTWMAHPSTSARIRIGEEGKGREGREGRVGEEGCVDSGRSHGIKKLS